MHLNGHLARECRRLEEKTKRTSPGKRNFDLQFRVIEKTISTALPARTTHQLRPRNILFTAQHAPLTGTVDYDLQPTITSRLSASSRRYPSPQHSQRLSLGSAGFKSRCQSAFSRTQSLKQASQERKAERVLGSVGVMLQEGRRDGNREVYSLNLLRIHGSSEKKIRINNYFF